MEHWRKTSSVEPFPLGRRDEKRNLEVGDPSRNKKAPRVLPVVHVSQGVFRRPVDDGAVNLPGEAAPCVQVENKIPSKELGKIIWNLQQGTAAEEARTKLNLGAGTSTSLELQPPQRLTPHARLPHEGHTENRISGNEDYKTELGSKKTQPQSPSEMTKTPPVDDRAARFYKHPHRIDDKQHREAEARNRVMDILHRFREYCDQLSDMKRKNWNEKEKHFRRVDLVAAQLMKNEFGYKYSSTEKQYLGHVPGVKIGDKFYYRMELHVLGLHRPPRSGIDTMVYGGVKIATSVVASGGYNDYMSDPNTLIYCGHGRNASGNQEQVEDQKLESGNRALLNSKRAKKPVRVIKGGKELHQCSTIYTYDGLYTVEEMWKVRDSLHHKIVFKFKLLKIPGQS